MVLAGSCITAAYEWHIYMIPPIVYIAGAALGRLFPLVTFSVSLYLRPKGLDMDTAWYALY